MELEEMKSEWKKLDVRVHGLERDTHQKRFRSLVWRTHWAPAWDVALGLGTALVTGGFLGGNWQAVLDRPVGAIPAVLLHLFAVASMALGIQQWVLMGGLDLSAPLVETQRTVEHVRMLRVRGSQWMLAVALPLWVVFLLALLQAIAGYEAYLKAPGFLIAANIAFGAVVVGVSALVARRYGEVRWFQGFLDTLAGKELMAVKRHLAEIEAFGKESGMEG